LECSNAWDLEHTQGAMKDDGSFDLVFYFKKNGKDHETDFVFPM